MCFPKRGGQSYARAKAAGVTPYSRYYSTKRASATPAEASRREAHCLSASSSSSSSSSRSSSSSGSMFPPLPPPLLSSSSSSSSSSTGGIGPGVCSSNGDGTASLSDSVGRNGKRSGLSGEVVGALIASLL